MLGFNCVPENAREHVVQFYQSDQALLTRNVTDFLSEGLKQGEAALVITTTERNAAFARELRESGVDFDAAIQKRELLFADAQQTLQRFMVDGRPDWLRFQRTIEALLREIRPQTDRNGLRAYGDMVGLLWQQRQYEAAIQLERFWNKLMTVHSFHLFCAYPIDVFGSDFDPALLDPLLSAQTQLMCTGKNQELCDAIDRAVDEVLGPNVEGWKTLLEDKPTWASLPEAEAVILWIRRNVPQLADEILAQARRHYQAVR